MLRYFMTNNSPIKLPSHPNRQVTPCQDLPSLLHMMIPPFAPHQPPLSKDEFQADHAHEVRGLQEFSRQLSQVISPLAPQQVLPSPTGVIDLTFSPLYQPAPRGPSPTECQTNRIRKIKELQDFSTNIHCRFPRLPKHQLTNQLHEHSNFIYNKEMKTRPSDDALQGNHKRYTSRPHIQRSY